MRSVHKYSKAAIIQLRHGNFHFLESKNDEIEMQGLQPPDINELFSEVFFEVNESEMDSLFLAEWQLTKAELQSLINIHGMKSATLETTKPFLAFLTNRWSRILGNHEEKNEEEKILGTDLIYSYAFNKPASLLCINVANALHQFQNYYSFKARGISAQKNMKSVKAKKTVSQVNQNEMKNLIV